MRIAIFANKRAKSQAVKKNYIKSLWNAIL